MKKMLVILVIVLAAFTVSCQKKDVSIDNNIGNIDLTNDKENSENESDSLNTDTEITDITEKTDVSDVYLIYYEDYDGVIFDKSLTQSAFKDYIKANSLILEDSHIYKLSLENGNIVDLQKQDEAGIQGIYIGMADSNIAQFSYNSAVFSLNVSEEQMHQLEGISENNLLSLKIKKSDDSGLRLIEFNVN